MKFRIVLIALFCTFISGNAIAKTLPDNTFPYGLLELRGYAMEMNKDGKFRIYSGDTIFVKGSFKIEGNKMTVFDSSGLYACRGKRMNPGIYYWTVHDHGLYLMLVKDNCGARRTAFLEAPLTMSPKPE
ncbi:MAG: hypothetical protein Q9M24_07445 [Mariprofundaceae bacterium]|nr:hypothetical protein [Mariprofundaceae bacterium]